MCIHFLEYIDSEPYAWVRRLVYVTWRPGAGLVTGEGQDGVVGNSLDSLMGIWTEDEAAKFNEATKEFARTDEDLLRL